MLVIHMIWTRDGAGDGAPDVKLAVANVKIRKNVREFLPCRNTYMLEISNW